MINLFKLNTFAEYLKKNAYVTYAAALNTPPSPSVCTLWIICQLGGGTEQYPQKRLILI